MGSLDQSKGTRPLWSVTVFSVLAWAAFSVAGALSVPWVGDCGLMALSLDAAEAIAAGGNHLQDFWRNTTFYPPGYIFSLGFLIHVLPNRETAPLVLNLFLLLLAGGAIFGTARKIGGRASGMAAAVVFFLMPATSLFSRVAGMDLSLTAFVAFSLWALVRSDGFLRPGFSLLTGLLLGMGMMVKWTFVLYLAVPVFAGLLSALTDPQNPGLRPRSAGVVAAVLSATVVGGWWYFGPADLGILLSSSSADPSAWIWRNVPVFGAPLWLSLFGALGLAFGVAAIFSRGERARRVLLPAALLGPLILLFLVPHKEVRYAFPLLPAVAVLIGVGMTHLLKRENLVAGVLGAVLVASGFFFFDVNIRRPMAPNIDGRLVALPDLKCLRAAEDFDRALGGFIARDEALDSSEDRVVMWNAMDMGEQWLTPNMLSYVRKVSTGGDFRYQFHEPLDYRFFFEEFGTPPYLLVSERLLGTSLEERRTRLRDFSGDSVFLADPGLLGRVDGTYEKAAEVRVPCVSPYFLFRRK